MMSDLWSIVSALTPGAIVLSPSVTGDPDGTDLDDYLTSETAMNPGNPNFNAVAFHGYGLSTVNNDKLTPSPEGVVSMIANLN